MTATIPLYAGWIIYIGVAILTFIIIYFASREDLPLWQKIMAALVTSSIVNLFILPIIRFKKNNEWAYVLLVFLTWLIPLLFISYRFASNLNNLDNQIIT